MRKQRTSPAISYLLECTIALFFFAISATIIISLFAQANMKQTNSTDTNNAVLIAQSIVSELKNEDKVTLEDTLHYNEFIQKEDNGQYKATLVMQDNGFILEGTLKVFKNDTCILEYPFGMERKEASL